MATLLEENHAYELNVLSIMVKNHLKTKSKMKDHSKLESDDEPDVDERTSTDDDDDGNSGDDDGNENNRIATRKPRLLQLELEIPSIRTLKIPFFKLSLTILKYIHK